jgi:hypothetical protein
VARLVGPVALADVVVLVEVIGTVEVVETVEAVEIVLLFDVVEVEVVDRTVEEVDETPGCAFPCSMNVI